MNNKITIEVDNIDEAIIALGAIVAARGKGVVPVGKKGEPAGASSEVKAGAAGAGTPPVQGGAPAAPRKGRSDKGQPRGPYKKDSEAPAAATVNGAPEVPPAPPVAEEPKVEPTAGVASTEPAVSSPAPSVGSAPSAEDCQKKLEEVFKSKPTQSEGIALAQECLARVGVARVRDIPPELRAQFIAACGEKLKS